MRIGHLVLPAVGLVLVASGCSVSASGGSTASVSTDTLESTITDRLEEQVGKRPDSVECPDRLKAEVDATVRCSLSSGPLTYGVTVTARSVKDEKIRYGIEVDDTPQ